MMTETLSTMPQPSGCGEISTANVTGTSELEQRALPNEKRTLYVGNLSPEVNEYMLSTVFNAFGVCTSIKIMRDPSNRFDPYAFIEFSTNQQANAALSSLTRIKFMDKELVVNWATTPSQGAKKQGYSIFVGDLGLDTDDSHLHNAFISYGPIIDSKVVRYTDGRSRGYAFITFENEADAEEAITRMDRFYLLNKSIRCNWATRKAASYENKPHFQPKVYEEVLKESSESNCTVYCGGIMNGMTEEVIREKFKPYGAIVDLKIFRDKGFAFVKLTSHELAAKAISELHSTNLDKFVIKCSWGKENFSSSNFTQSVSTNGSSGVPAVPVVQPYAAAAAAGYNNSQYYDYCQNYYQYYYQYWHQQNAGTQKDTMNGGGSGIPVRMEPPKSGATPLLQQPGQYARYPSGFSAPRSVDVPVAATAAGPAAPVHGTVEAPTSTSAGGPMYTARFGNSRQHPYWPHAAGSGPRFGDSNVGSRPNMPTGGAFSRPMYN